MFLILLMFEHKKKQTLAYFLPRWKKKKERERGKKKKIDVSFNLLLRSWKALRSVDWQQKHNGKPLLRRPRTVGHTSCLAKRLTKKKNKTIRLHLQGDIKLCSNACIFMRMLLFLPAYKLSDEKVQVNFSTRSQPTAFPLSHSKNWLFFLALVFHRDSSCVAASGRWAPKDTDYLWVMISGMQSRLFLIYGVWGAAQFLTRWLWLQGSAGCSRMCLCTCERACFPGHGILRLMLLVCNKEVI